MPEKPQELDLDLIERTLELMPRLPRYPALFEDMRALLAEVKRLKAALAESERWSLVLKRLYYDELAKNGRFECCCCGEVASDDVGHRCESKKGEVGVE